MRIWDEITDAENLSRPTLFAEYISQHASIAINGVSA